MHEDWIQLTLDNGATKAVIIPESQIVTSTTFRDICKTNACGGWGRNWTCPPACGDIEDLIARVRSFSHGLLFQTIHEIEDSYDFEGMTEGSAKHAESSFRIRDNVATVIPGETLTLSAGGCRMCERCAKLDDEPCRMPDKAMTSLEACGIDVYNTTKDTPLKYINGQNTVTYFGMILFNEQA